MARTFAANSVATAVMAAINVSAIQTLCQGGVSRHRRQQAPPYVSIGPCAEEPDDTFGTAGYGSVVEVPIHIITSGEDANGDARALTIASAIAALLDEPVALTVTGWSVRMVEWVETRGQVVQFLDGLVGYDTAMTWRIYVRAA
jgi:hypothetical protein